MGMILSWGENSTSAMARTMNIFIGFKLYFAILDDIRSWVPVLQKGRNGLWGVELFSRPSTLDVLVGTSGTSLLKIIRSGWQL